MTTFNRRAFNGLALSALATGLAGRQAEAAAYPDHPIELVVPFAAGGGTDVVARTIGQKAGDILKGTVVIENKPGATTVIGTNAVATSKPDGYTWLLGSNALPLNPTLQKHLPYDTLKDFIPVSLIARQSFVLSVSAKFPAKNVAELIAMAKASPGKIVYGTAGVGSGNHLAGLSMTSLAGIDFNWVPYTDIGQRISAEINGYVQVSISPLSEVQAGVNSGQIRLLGIGDAQRDPTMPDLPTIAETVPGYNVPEWEGILVRAGTPATIVTQINAALGEAVKDPGVIQKLAAAGIKPNHSTPDEFKKFLVSEIAKWRNIIIKAGLQPK